MRRRQVNNQRNTGHKRGQARCLHCKMGELLFNNINLLFLSIYTFVNVLLLAGIFQFQSYWYNTCTDAMQPLPMLFLLASNMATFLLWGIDKQMAINGGLRVPTVVICGFTGFTGAIGAFAAQTAFNHKTMRTPLPHGAPRYQWLKRMPFKFLWLWAIMYVTVAFLCRNILMHHVVLPSFLLTWVCP